LTQRMWSVPARPSAEDARPVTSVGEAGRRQFDRLPVLDTDLRVAVRDLEHLGCIRHRHGKGEREDEEVSAHSSNPCDGSNRENYTLPNRPRPRLFTHARRSVPHSLRAAG
jgi:hypothetical protein